MLPIWDPATTQNPLTVRPARVALTAMAIHRVPGPPTLPTAAWINKPLTALALAAAEGILYRASR